MAKIDLQKKYKNAGRLQPYSVVGKVLASEEDTSDATNEFYLFALPKGVVVTSIIAYIDGNASATANIKDSAGNIDVNVNAGTVEKQDLNIYNEDENLVYVTFGAELTQGSLDVAIEVVDFDAVTGGRVPVVKVE